MNHVLQYAIAFAITSYTALTLWRGWAASQITDTLAVFKETDSGESITFQLNFKKSDTEEAKFERLQKAFSLAEVRHKFTVDRFNQVIDEAQKEKASQLKVATSQ